MNQLNFGKHKLLSKSTALLSSALMISAALLSGKAKAQVADYVGTSGTSTTVTYYANESGTSLAQTGLGSATPCSSGGYSGLTNNGVTTFSTANGRVYFKVTPNSGYVVNVTGITAKLRRSGSGISKVRFVYSLDNGATWTNDGVDHAPDNSSCGSSSTVQSWGGGTLPTGVTAANGIIIAMYPYAPIAAGGVIQFNEIHVAGSITAAAGCSGTPTAGTVSGTPSSFCGSGSAALSLSGASAGAGIVYQWQNSSDNVTFTNITGATNNTYTTPTISATTYYRANVTCTASSLTAATPSTTITVNAVPTVSAITGTLSVAEGSTSSLANATTGGTWSSSTTSVASIGGTTGVVTGNSVGTSTISYTVTSAGCTNAATAVVTVSLGAAVLAEYNGATAGGTGTTVNGIANETVSSLSQINFGTPASPCSTGGLSGITVSTVYATYSAAGPRVFYQILPNTGYQLNITGALAVTRESGTGPQKARMAYSLDGGSTWSDEGTDILQATGGSCGAASNTWNYTGGLTVMGVSSTTNGIIIAVYPYNPSASGGTFQLNKLVVYGNVAPAGSCTGTTAGTATAATSTICNSGSTTIALTGGSSGSGISYQWQNSTDGVTYANISGATNTSYATGTLTATSVNYYQVVTTCAFAGTPSTSSVATVSVNATPSAGSITGVPSYVYIGTPSTLGATVAGGVWSSNHVGIATVGSSAGDVNGVIPGTSVITYAVTTGGCTGTTTATVNVLKPSPVAVYLGTDGNSVATDAFAGVSSTILNAVGTGTATPCSTGGLSGLTVNTVYATYNSSNPSVSFSVTTDPGKFLDVTGFDVTLRKSGSGPQKARLAYSLDGGTTWNDDGVNNVPDNTSCGNSTTDYSYASTLPTSFAGTVIFAVYPFNATASTGVIQVNAMDISGTVSDCATAAAISGNTGAFCGGTTLSLGNATTGGTWSSSNASVATVDASGVVTGSVEGTATISYAVTSPCGVSVATTVVTVNAAVLAITGNPIICGVGGTTTLSDLPAGGEWGTYNTTIADVDYATGVVTGNSVGTTTIEYYLETGNGCNVVADIDVTVNALPSVDAITGAGDDICVGNTQSLSDATTGGTWSSSNTSVATVEAATGTVDAVGVVTGVALGSATITYTVTDASGCSAFVTADVNVSCGGAKPGRQSAATVANSVKLYPNPATETLHIAAAETVNATIISMDGKVLMEQNNAADINISTLTPGIYMIKVYTQDNTLVKTTRFTKQ